MSNYERKDGDLVIYLNDIEGNKPILSGSTLINGEEKDVSLWAIKKVEEADLRTLHAAMKKCGITMFTGNIKEKWKPDGKDWDNAKEAATSTEPVQNTTDDEIPF